MGVANGKARHASVGPGPGLPRGSGRGLDQQSRSVPPAGPGRCRLNSARSGTGWLPATDRWPSVRPRAVSQTFQRFAILRCSPSSLLGASGLHHRASRLIQLRSLGGAHADLLIVCSAWWRHCTLRFGRPSRGAWRGAVRESSPATFLPLVQPCPLNIPLNRHFSRRHPSWGWSPTRPSPSA